ncbi:N-acetylmuramoyl-L-alanine amidase family protein [Bernardetia sp.]|uniref:N-acetylmuramoyl-L-alanine amidase family protein n=1 Tax=Bernardetia sp. TaxID=1937974 RepID=UPI0025C66377|nr:N-acetylmuramoyl-L-alanine amidase [Bernardetia sp.]
MIWRNIKSLLIWFGFLTQKKEEVKIIYVPIVISDEEIGEDTEDEKELIEVLIEETEKEQPKETKEPKIPKNGDVIIWRFGHSLNTSGKETPKQDDGTIIKEYTLNKQIGTKAIAEGDKLGYESIIANPYDFEDPNEDRALDIVVGHINRINNKALTEKKRVICIDLHCNAHQPNKNKVEFTSASGTVTFYFERRIKNAEGKELVQYSKKGKQLAISIHEQMVKRTGLPDRAWSFNRGKAVGANFQALRETLCVTATVECAFMTNRSDLEYLKSEEGQATIAKAIIKGVDNYFSL